ncbi:hypothetical protein [uncultured Methanobrevibacter sp.]|uniref:hypothetical protein n=1 Tax=uncultured Methanobrevibacter sp. TaxID=253161 RepID=UPI00262593D0|nr:hypothetical protein [uncultured Methanobrevibacter sp.]
MVTKKTNTSEKNVKKTEKKAVLYELVSQSPEREYIIVGALSKAGLKSQYDTEKEEVGVKNIKPTITESEFNKILKDYRG